MNFIDQKLEEYCDNHTSTHSELLHKIERETHLEVLRPRMLSGNLQGRFLSLISKLIQPKYILEIGTYTGYSALCMAEGLVSEGKLITIDKNKELENRVRKYFSESAYSHQLNFISGNALEEIPLLMHDFDLVFMDADKKNYCNYLDLVVPKMKSGALLIADNVLWSGKVVEPIGPKDKDTPELLKFNKMVNDHPLLENALLPLRDGLMMARKI